ncbi:MAG: type II toxin-antitoxin system RelE/ParE family toxin [Rickettsiales bacterium]
MSQNNKITLIWTVAATADVIRLREFIEPHNKKSAERAADTLKKAAATLLDYPQIGKPIENKDEREFPVSFGKKWYVIRYKIHGNIIAILRIWHRLEDK